MKCAQGKRESKPIPGRVYGDRGKFSRGVNYDVRNRNNFLLIIGTALPFLCPSTQRSGCPTPPPSRASRSIEPRRAPTPEKGRAGGQIVSLFNDGVSTAAIVAREGVTERACAATRRDTPGFILHVKYVFKGGRQSVFYLDSSATR
jgi:hypothetical protein